MKINIETYGLCKYDEIYDEYGSVLKNFGLVNESGRAKIEISLVDDLFRLEKEINDFVQSSEKCIYYFGIMIRSYDDGTPYLEIKDNYD